MRSLLKQLVSHSPSDRQLFATASLFLYAVFGYALYAVFMAASGFHLLALLMIAGCVSFALAFRLISSGRRFVALAMSIVTITVTSFTSDLYLGWDYGGHYYVLCVFPLIMGSELIGKKAKLAVAAVGVALYIVMHQAALRIVPLGSLAPMLRALIADVNLIASFGAVSLVFFRYSRATVFNEIELKKLNARVSRLAHFDQLTGIANRRCIDDVLENRVESSALTGKVFTAGLIDIDDFKKVNDAYGHQVGDLALKGVAAAMPAVLRADDVVGRWGGEEFIIILPGADMAHGLEALERVRSAVAGLSFESGAGLFGITVTIGCAQWERGQHAEDVVRVADERLYAGKKAGKNRVVGA